MSIYGDVITFVNRNRKLSLLLLFLLSITVQSCFLSFLPGPVERNQNTDYDAFYEPVAENLIKGKGLIDRRGNIAVRYPPGFPLILAPIFQISESLGVEKLQGVAVFNVLVLALCSLLVFLIGEIVFNQRIALIGSLLWITYPFNLWLTKQPNSEIPFVFLLLLAIYLFIYALNKNRLWVIFVVGLLLALTALIRPVSILLIGVFILIILFYSRFSIYLRVVSIVLITAGYVITLIPWEYGVYKETGEIIPLSKGGTPSVIDGLQYAFRDKFEKGQYDMPEDTLDFMVRMREKNDELETTGQVLGYVVQEFKKDPGTVVKLYATKIARSWYATSELWYENYILPIQIFYLFLGVTGIIMSLKFYRQKIIYVLLFVMTIMYFWAMTVLVVSILRYMMPVMGLVLIFSAIPIDRVLRGFRLTEAAE